MSTAYSTHQHSSESEVEQQTLSLEDYTKKTSVVVYFLTFLFIYTSVKVAMGVEMYYLLLALVLLMIGIWVESESEHVKVFPRSHLKLSELPHQVLGGFILAVAFILVATMVGTFSASVADPGAFLSTLIPQIIVIGGVETLMLIIYTSVVIGGKYVYPFIFAFSHTKVATYWSVLAFPNWTIMFFLYAVSMAVVFYVLYSLRDILPEPYSKFFGAVNVAVFHGVINTVVILSTLQLGGGFIW